MKTVRKLPRSAHELARHFDISNFPSLVARFLYDQLHPSTPLASTISPPASYERIIANPDLTTILVFSSAVATFYAPSDISGIGGMRRERIRATASWRKGPARHDCVFVETDAKASGMRGLHVARVRLFFSFKHQGEQFPCALVEWFEPTNNNPDELTGMWIVEPEFDHNGSRTRSVIHIDTIMRAAHLIGVYGETALPRPFHFSDSLDTFQTFYVNKYVDHHAHEIAF